jgi:hypothetical protein
VRSRKHSRRCGFGRSGFETQCSIRLPLNRHT